MKTYEDLAGDGGSQIIEQVTGQLQKTACPTGSNQTQGCPYEWQRWCR